MTKAMKNEYDTLQDNHTWTLVPPNKRVLFNRVSKIKKNQDDKIEKYKARLVARGNMQK